MVKCQFTNPVELARPTKFRAPTLNGKKRRLNSALTICDLRMIAKRRTLGRLPLHRWFGRG